MKPYLICCLFLVLSACSNQGTDLGKNKAIKISSQYTNSEAILSIQVNVFMKQATYEEFFFVIDRLVGMSLSTNVQAFNKLYDFNLASDGAFSEKLVSAMAKIFNRNPELFFSCICAKPKVFSIYKDVITEEYNKINIAQISNIKCTSDFIRLYKYLKENPDRLYEALPDTFSQ